jgi:hypothetical protein
MPAVVVLLVKKWIKALEPAVFSTIATSDTIHVGAVPADPFLTWAIISPVGAVVLTPIVVNAFVPVQVLLVPRIDTPETP